MNFNKIINELQAELHSQGADERWIRVFFKDPKTGKELNSQTLKAFKGKDGKYRYDDQSEALRKNLKSKYPNQWQAIQKEISKAVQDWQKFAPNSDPADIIVGKDGKVSLNPER